MQVKIEAVGKRAQSSAAVLCFPYHGGNLEALQGWLLNLYQHDDSMQRFPTAAPQQLYHELYYHLKSAVLRLRQS